MTALRAFGLSDPGLVRGHNEDCFAIEAEENLYVVADGMGGHSYGEIASRISVRSICEFIRQGGEASDGSSSETEQELQPHSRLLKEAILAAQEQVLGAVDEDSALRGMGTTVVGLYVRDGVTALAHVGDSRIYRLRKGELELLTQDHTWINEQVMAGFLSEEQARTHPYRNVVTRALGGDNRVEVEVHDCPLEADDLFLLCSDGLTGMLLDSKIQEILERDQPLHETCQSLIDAANDRGGADNITAILVSAARDE